MKGIITMPDGNKAEMTRFVTNPVGLFTLAEGEFVPTMEECEFMVENSEEFREFITEQGSVTTSSINDGWIASVEVNNDFEPNDICVFCDGKFVREQSEYAERIGHCTTPVFQYI